MSKKEAVLKPTVEQTGAEREANIKNEAAKKELQEELKKKEKINIQLELLTEDDRMKREKDEEARRRDAQTVTKKKEDSCILKKGDTN